MGSCVSVQKDPESTMKLRLVFGSKNGKLVIPSPVKSKPTVVNGADIKVPALPLDSQHSSPHPVTIIGSKEEMFFDSQPWLESDCEDDFYSIKGDFSPPCGNTPVHQSFSEGTPNVNEVIFTDRSTISVIESFPTDKKKKLSELLRESLQGDQDINVQKATNYENGVSAQKDGETTGIDLTVKAAVGTPPHSSVCSNSERTPDREFKPVSKSAKSGQCCLPRLLSSHSFNEKRKKMSSPAHSGS